MTKRAYEKNLHWTYYIRVAVKRLTDVVNAARFKGPARAKDQPVTRSTR